jgi:hypothetical protein
MFIYSSISTNKQLLYVLLAWTFFSAAGATHAEENSNADMVYVEGGEYSGRVGYPDITYKSIYIASFLSTNWKYPYPIMRNASQAAGVIKRR